MALAGVLQNQQEEVEQPPPPWAMAGEQNQPPHSPQ
eukprot:CAMPEP_0194580560 /NCGR_PEP_ID=MMETSP0292-20121207/14282_1 /TAXON_ID=39354 /ORGANISM="Heterosigma akashiwo, Strain CCMP2393" /LENGTH=35 /DNA_ID= /DNA_START= /DNA_END= /DNA_ORIENTATION=